jgi:hypothetical protein
MKFEIVIWTVSISVLAIASALGLLAVLPVVIIVVPALIFALGCGVAFVMGGHSAHRINLYRALSSALIALIGLTQFPLRFGFLASKGSLSALAHDMSADKAPALPVRAGLYVIRSAAVKDDGTVCLWTDVNPQGKAGFVCGDSVKIVDLWRAQNLDCAWWYVTLD